MVNARLIPAAPKFQAQGKAESPAGCCGDFCFAACADGREDRGKLVPTASKQNYADGGSALNGIPKYSNTALLRSQIIRSGISVKQVVASLKRIDPKVEVDWLDQEN